MTSSPSTFWALGGRQASLPSLILLGVVFSFSAHKKPTKNIFFGSRLESSSPRHAFRATSKPGVAASLRSCQQTWAWRRPELGLRPLDAGSFPRRGPRGHKGWGWALRDPSGGPSLPKADGAWPSHQGGWRALRRPGPGLPPPIAEGLKAYEVLMVRQSRALLPPYSTGLLAGTPPSIPFCAGLSFTPQALTIQLVPLTTAVEPGVGSPLLPTGPSCLRSRGCGPREG